MKQPNKFMRVRDSNTWQKTVRNDKFPYSNAKEIMFESFYDKIRQYFRRVYWAILKENMDET